MEEQDISSYIRHFQSNDRLGAIFGYSVISLSKKSCVIEYEVKQEHFNPNGTLHGGALFTVMDSSQGAFIHFILEDSYAYGATGTASIRYFLPLRQGKIRISTSLKERNRRKYILESTAFTESGETAAVLEEIWIAILKK